MISVNLTGAMVLTRHLLPSMIEQDRGYIMMVASIQGIAGTPGFVTYSATKGGLVRFAEALRRELSHHRIVITTVLPPAVQTQAFERAQKEAPGLLSWSLFPAVPVEQVAKRAVRGMVLGTPTVYAGAQSALAAAANRVSHGLLGFILEHSFHEDRA
jgi:2-hydroxycyclohexanecarboxyl-CoA dehydrogenase